MRTQRGVQDCEHCSSSPSTSGDVDFSSNINSLLLSSFRFALESRQLAMKTESLTTRMEMESLGLGTTSAGVSRFALRKRAGTGARIQLLAWLGALCFGYLDISSKYISGNPPLTVLLPRFSQKTANALQ